MVIHVATMAGIEIIIIDAIVIIISTIIIIIVIVYHLCLCSYAYNVLQGL